VLLCNNSLHEALDVVQEAYEPPVPIFHAVKKTAESARELGISRALLLGTSRTMECGYYPRVWSEYGIELHVPGSVERSIVQRIQSKLAAGKEKLEVIQSTYADFFKKLLDRHGHLDGVVLACTELPLVIGQEMCDLQILNPIAVQCEAAINFSLG
jgi:aspartate racemase